MPSVMECSCASLTGSSPWISGKPSAGNRTGESTRLQQLTLLEVCASAKNVSLS